MKFKNLCKLSVKFLTLLSLCFFVNACMTSPTKKAPEQEQIEVSETAININEASIEELEKLPNVGAKVAERIIKHRNKFGDFRRAEHVLLVRGISDKRFRKFRNMIKVK